MADEEGFDGGGEENDLAAPSDDQLSSSTSSSSAVSSDASRSAAVIQSITPEITATFDTNCRLGLYRYVQRAANDYLSAKRAGGGHPSVSEQEARFWRAFAVSQEGGYAEAIREFDSLVGNPDIALAVTAALINTHKQFKLKDSGAVDKLKEQLKTLSKTSNDKALCFAGRYFLHAQKEKQAKQCIEKLLQKNKFHVEGLALLGWLNLNAGQGRQERRGLQFFDAAVKIVEQSGSKDRDICALLGRCKYYERKKKYERVLEDLDVIIVSFPDFLPALNEKAKTLMIMNQWDEALHTANRVLRKDGSDVQALRFVVVYYITRESKPTEISKRLAELADALEKNEPKNAKLYYDVAQLTARLATRKKSLLQQTYSFIERACKLESGNSQFICEQGLQLLQLEEYTQAIMCFQEAAKLDEGNLQALHGSIKCKILQGNYKEAEQELEFLAEIQASIGSNAELTFLHALLAWQKENDGAKSVEFLNQAVTEHLKALDDVAAGFDYLVAYNPDFVLELVQQYMMHIGTEPLQTGDPPNPLLNHCIKLLNQLTDFIPGNLSGQLMLARTCFIAGEFENAERAIVTSLKLDPQCAPAHIIQAQVNLNREQYKQCSQSLEQARSLDFEVRNTPVYHLMKAKLLEASDQVSDALKVLQAAMELPGVRRANVKNMVPLQERISIFLELAAVHLKLGQIPEATKAMSDAKIEFSKTAEAHRITLADADLCVQRKEHDSALAMLKQVPADSIYYTRAKIRMADIYLSYKKNKKLYSSCYNDLAYQNNSVHSYILLGEAYMRIQEPDKAIRAYEEALKLNPEDPQLASRIGKALITTHDYQKAVQYYETACKGESAKLHLYHELAELYLSLKRFEDAIRVLKDAMAVAAAQGKSAAGEDLFSMISDVKSLTLLSDVHAARGDFEGVRSALSNAFNLQTNILSKIREENAEQKREQKEVAAALCYKLAEHYQTKEKEEEKALQFYNESLKFNEHNEKSRFALAKLHLINSELDQCQTQCVTLLRIDPNNKEASMMLADIMFRKNEHEAATFHFQQLLEKNPNSYEALSKLITLLKRAGKLSEAPRFLKVAERFHTVKAGAGYYYCKGLFHWYNNENREALNQFNLARKDGEWGRPSTMNMVEIYLNPDNSELFAEMVEAKGDTVESIAAAERLLKELEKVGERSSRFRVLDAYCMMASKQKPKLDKSVDNLLHMLSVDRDYVPALLATANGYVLQGQPAKARNQLKRISKMKLNPDFATEFERAWLMLADTYIAVAKYEFAQELCRKTLANNKSSPKAWEMLGVIMEKEQAYKDAADHYEHAWHFMNQSSPAVGFKLAFNYLKAKRYVEAIDVCHKVLKSSPDYPKIRKEILEKARLALRP
jgi:tetratricopeptide repeat protein 21B